MYLEHVGFTFQGGFLIAEGEEVCSATSNRILARMAGIRNGDVVLDAGCGVCGPAIDIAGEFEEVKLIGVTISPEQANVAQQRIRAAELSRRVSVTIGDYHALPFADDVFDVALFLESAGYSQDQVMLFSDAKRVLRPGGTIFIKDVWCKEGPLSAVESNSLAMLNENFAYLFRRISEVSAALAAAGFVEIAAEDISSRISVKHQINAMFDAANAYALTSFGRRHARYYASLPTSSSVLSGKRPL
jgi:cyclopropane fatty-acyl-phospholipid synthase-like methyltransferase